MTITHRAGSGTRVERTKHEGGPKVRRPRSPNDVCSNLGIYIYIKPSSPPSSTNETYLLGFLSTPTDNNRRSHDWPGLEKRQETVQEVPPRHATRFPQGTPSGRRGRRQHRRPVGGRGFGGRASFREVIKKKLCQYYRITSKFYDSLLDEFMSWVSRQRRQVRKP